MLLTEFDSVGNRDEGVRISGSSIVNLLYFNVGAFTIYQLESNYVTLLY